MAVTVCPAKNAVFQPVRSAKAIKAIWSELKTLLPHILRQLRGGRGFALATVFEQEGSIPRKAGARMMIRADNQIIGTIGGGLFEADVIRIAEDVFKTGKDGLLVSATQIEMSECEKVLTSFYIRDNRFPAPGDELWGWFAENYPENQIPELKTDGWFTPYHFVTDEFLILSAGPDKAHNTHDDLKKHYPKLSRK